MHSVLWVTEDCFVDHDYDVVPKLSSLFKIKWVVLLSHKGSRYVEADFSPIKEKYPQLEIQCVKLTHKMRYPQNLSVYKQIIKISKEISPDVIHLDMNFVNPWALYVIHNLPKEKTILVVHQGVVHSGMNHHWINNMVRRKLFKQIKYVKMFSEHQAELFETVHPMPQVFRFTLPLIYFGTPTAKRDLDSIKIRFLSFGIINYAKNIELLIDAAEELYEMGERDFVVSINGGCNNWSFYKSRIKHPELFETDIRLVPNELIPNLFTRAHFFVQPYRVVSQSGPLKIAYSYNTPVIVSDLPGFTDEVVEGVTGFVFERENKDSLVATMKKAMAFYRNGYANMLDSMKKYVQDNYSEKAMADNYLKMFNTVTTNGK